MKRELLNKMDKHSPTFHDNVELKSFQISKFSNVKRSISPIHSSIH